MFIQKGMQDSFMDMEDTIKHEMMEQNLKGELHYYYSTKKKKKKDFQVGFFFLLFCFLLMVLTQSYLGYYVSYMFLCFLLEVVGVLCYSKGKRSYGLWIFLVVSELQYGLLWNTIF